jgi:hypothetical protein
MAAMGRALVLLAFDRESLMMAAFGSLGAAGLVVSAGAWVLLARERRMERMQKSTPAETAGPLPADPLSP